LPGILPPLSPREALEVSIVHSLAGALPEDGLLHTRPYRDPHHSASQPALIGGGQKSRPGEISLAHHGVLFLDELPEFQKSTLESLRQPLETGEVLVARVQSHVTWPASFQLIAAMNPCRCGFFGDPSQECTKAPRCAEDYQSKLSGPLLDRIDLQVEVPAVSISDLSNAPAGEPSEKVAERVGRARARQKKRFEKMGSDYLINARAEGEALEAMTPLDPAAKTMLSRAADQMKLSARAWHRILRVARTIADLEGEIEVLLPHHVAEALSFRRLRLKDL
jgi:magnesium chelatase family protein